ncbi:cell envelope integrity protein TolA [Escherichia coli]|uniref:cell envelope integrity protein TolA n=1 Tax=Escherichia coli TaxID=562 RepID=UPI001F49AC2F|nr:cell envelope integrity protein TolA [Escherichia coli]MCH6601759.1 protein TolA [Escherichia coli]
MVKLKNIIKILLIISTPAMAINNAKVITHKDIGKDINNYAKKIKESIETNMEDTEKYRGKTCTIRIKIRENGSLIYAREEGGNRELCKSAIKAIKKSELPEPPSKEVYEVFKNAPLDFKP